MNLKTLSQLVQISTLINYLLTEPNPTREQAAAVTGMSCENFNLVLRRWKLLIKDGDLDHEPPAED